MRIPEPVIKVCGVRDRHVLAAAVESGATAVGFNFVDWSRRVVSLQKVEELLTWARGEYVTLPLCIGVFADAPDAIISDYRSRLSLDLIQMHGAEPLERVRRHTPAIRAFGIGETSDLEHLLKYPEAQLIVDSRRNDGVSGGTGKLLDRHLLRAVCQRSGVIVAGGLRADNVSEVVEWAAPSGVDTASGAESSEGAPSAVATRRFVAAAKRAFSKLVED